MARRREFMEKYNKKSYKSDVENGSFEKFPKDLFEKKDVVVLAETAHGQHDKTILRFLDEFNSQIGQIFIELPVDYQDSVDTYLTRGEVDKRLEDFFVGAELEGKNVRGLLKIFDKAKEIGKRIICFDASKTKTGEYQKISKRGRYFLRGESRDEDMFVNFQRYYEQMPGKYLLIVGANHAEEGRTPGGDERLGTRLKRRIGEKYVSFEMQRGK